MVAPFLFAPLLLAANIDSPHPSLIPPEGRERLLREAQVSLKRENPAFEWHTPPLVRDKQKSPARLVNGKVVVENDEGTAVGADELWAELPHWCDAAVMKSVEAGAYEIVEAHGAALGAYHARVR